MPEDITEQESLPVQFTVIDFGCPFRISDEGMFCGVTESALAADSIRFLQACNFKICLAEAVSEATLRAIAQDYYLRQFMGSDSILLAGTPLDRDTFIPAHVFARDGPELPELLCNIFFKHGGGET